MNSQRHCLRRLAAAWLVLGALCTGGCKIAEVGSINLDALHDEDGGHRYVAKTTTAYQYVLGQLLPTNITNVDFKPAEPVERAVGDPSEECLDSLLLLASARPGVPSTEAALVRHCGWLALHDPSVLSRERALIELGRAAERLGLGRPEPPPSETSGPVELAEALVRVVDSLHPILLGGEGASAEQRAEFEAACSALAALPMDLEGGRRVLRAIERVTRGLSGTQAVLAPLYDLSRSVQRSLARRVLSEASGDPDQRVRAAAISANHRAYGAPYLLFQLKELERGFLRRGPRRFESEDSVRLLELVAAKGLPLEAAGSPEEAAELRYRLLLLLTNVAVSVGDFDERVRAAAMRTLGAQSGAGFHSLRFEDWSAWWQANDAALRPNGLEEGDEEP